MRAFVMQQHRGMCDVYLVDYADFCELSHQAMRGNLPYPTGTVSCADLRELPEDIAQLPMCAFIVSV